jgi:hypothetical protein
VGEIGESHIAAGVVKSSAGGFFLEFDTSERRCALKPFTGGGRCWNFKKAVGRKLFGGIDAG